MQILNSSLSLQAIISGGQKPLSFRNDFCVVAAFKEQWVERKCLLLHLINLLSGITLNFSWECHLYLIRHPATHPGKSILLIVKWTDYFKSSFELIFLNQHLDGFKLFLIKTLNWIWWYCHFAYSTYLMLRGEISGCFYSSRVSIYQVWAEQPPPSCRAHFQSVGEAPQELLPLKDKPSHTQQIWRRLLSQRPKLTEWLISTK